MAFLAILLVLASHAIAAFYIWDRYGDCSWGKHTWGPWADSKNGWQQVRECAVCRVKDRREY